MQQYREIKARHQDAILFFRMGDFYEMFYEDAETGARALGLTLTSRNSGAAAPVPLAGIPVKAVSEYIRRLVRQGFRVAICEQLEDPKLAKGPVKRGVGMAMGAFGAAVGRSSAVIHLNSQGQYELHVGVTDVGTAAKTTMALIAAEELGVPLAKVAVEIGRAHV